MESNCKGVFVKRFHIEHYITMLLSLCNEIIQMALEIFHSTIQRGASVCASQHKVDVIQYPNLTNLLDGLP
jgi:hypothetical protein